MYRNHIKSNLVKKYSVAEYKELRTPSSLRSQTADRDIDYNIRGQRLLQNELSTKIHKIYST